MSILGGVITNTIYILFPLSVYLIYQAYTRNIDNKEKNYFLELALFSSLYMLIRYGVLFKTLYPALLFSIPLLISYIKDKKLTAMIISVTLILFNYYIFHFSIYVLIFEYLAYYISYKITTNYKNRITKITNLFIAIRTFIIIFIAFFYIMPKASFSEVLYFIILSSLIFLFISYITIFLFTKAENVVNYNSTLNELSREKEIRESLFKITHEVKNPLAVCKGYLDILEGQDKKDYNKYLPIITSEINRTLHLMDDFLDYTKVKVEMEDADIYYFLEEVKNEMTPILINNNIEYEFNIPDDELYLDLDFNRMKQVFINIYKNSIEARKDNMKIVLDTYIDGNYLIIKISDNGIGMSEEVLNKIGENFYTTKKNGTGLGVSLSKEIVSLHGGELKYESKENHGTTALIRLPIKEEII